jgi:hypothetical protein
MSGNVTMLRKCPAGCDANCEWLCSCLGDKRCCIEQICPECSWMGVIDDTGYTTYQCGTRFRPEDPVYLKASSNKGGATAGNIEIPVQST